MKDHQVRPDSFLTALRTEVLLHSAPFPYRETLLTERLSTFVADAHCQNSTMVRASSRQPGQLTRNVNETTEVSAPRLSCAGRQCMLMRCTTQWTNEDFSLHTHAQVTLCTGHLIRSVSLSRHNPAKSVTHRHRGFRCRR